MDMYCSRWVNRIVTAVRHRMEQPAEAFPAPMTREMRGRLRTMKPAHLSELDTAPSSVRGTGD